MAVIEDLPEEILEIIFLLLSLPDLYRLQLGRADLPSVWVELAGVLLARVGKALVDSDGVAGYYHGAPLGEFLLCEEEGFYKQRGGPYRLVRIEGVWEVEHQEGFSPFISLARTSLPPKAGWCFRKGPTTLPDPALSVRLSQDSMLVCSSVLLSSSLCPLHYTGVFTRLDNTFSMGRPVFINTSDAVLWVGHSAWIVTEREVMVQKKKVKRHMVVVSSGGVAHTCPGDKRATWWVLGQGRRREDETMSVTCNHATSHTTAVLNNQEATSAVLLHR